jgi:glycosyltransferase involved in cell wall biosynthesis
MRMPPLAVNRVCIDAFNISLPKGSGIATYARNLNATARRLGVETQILYGPSEAPGDDKLINEVMLFDAASAPSIRRRMSLLKASFRTASAMDRTASGFVPTGEVIRRGVEASAPPCEGVWTAQDIFHESNRRYAALGRFTRLRFATGDLAPPEVVHWTCPLPIQAAGARNLYTIHDLVPLRLPFATLDNKRRFLSLSREICGTADQVVTVSEHSKQDLVRLLGVDEARVTVTYQSVDIPKAMLDVKDEEVAREIQGVFGLDWRDYFIFFGAIEPKKNLGRVIEAYLASGVRAPLVIIGGAAWLDESETRLLYPDLVEMNVLREGLMRRADRVRRYDYLPFRLLVSLIRGARATLLPSLYEGFGLPVLESMLLGTPVISSTEGALPEIAGDAALLVDPYDALALRRAIMAIDADADLRRELSDRGLRQAEKFSPQAYAHRLEDLYRKLS